MDFSVHDIFGHQEKCKYIQISNGSNISILHLPSSTFGKLAANCSITSSSLSINYFKVYEYNLCHSGGDDIMIGSNKYTHTNAVITRWDRCRLRDGLIGTAQFNLSSFQITKHSYHILMFNGLVSK